MKKTALCIIFCLIAGLFPAKADTLRFTCADSELLSDSALSVLQTILEKAALRIGKDACAIEADGETLLCIMADGRIGTGALVAPTEIAPQGTQSLEDTAAALTALLGDYEREEKKQLDLQEAGKSNRQLVYALTGEEWAARWTETVDILAAFIPQAQMLRTAEIVGKGTFKRYFDRSGKEIGAYFYAAEMHLNGEAREIRLELAHSGKGAYLAFRCPNKEQTRNVRISLHMKNREGAYTCSGDVRFINHQNSDVLTFSGSSKKVEATLAQKRGSAKNSYALTLAELSPSGCAYTLEENKKLALKGDVRFEKDEFALILPAVNADFAYVTDALAKRLGQMMQSLPADGAWQLLHSLQKGNGR